MCLICGQTLDGICRDESKATKKYKINFIDDYLVRLIIKNKRRAAHTIAN
jgi:hypothetical protein